MDNFRPFEFECRCSHDCGKGFAQMNPDFLDRLERARLYANSSFTLNSAFRCIKHNQDIGGTEGSAHTKGLAVDIKTPDSRSRFKIMYGLIKAGFKRIGVYENFIHVDDDLTKPVDVSWFGV